jgi:ribosome recycling factor
MSSSVFRPSFSLLRSSSQLLQPPYAWLSFMHYAKQKGKKSGKQSETEVKEVTFDARAAEQGMEGAISHFQKELANIRGGRANPGLLEPILVESASGRRVQLKQIGAVSQRNVSLLVVNVFDSNETQSVVRAIRESPLELQAKVESGEIQVPIPKPTTDMLQKMNKLVQQEAEHAKNAVRSSRHKALELIKTQMQAGSKDEKFRIEKEIQKMTDKWIAEIERIKALKEKDIKAN